jgi:hypothetical protein
MAGGGPSLSADARGLVHAGPGALLQGLPSRIWPTNWGWS